METSDDFGLSFGDIERRPVGLSQAGNHENDEQGQQRQPEPVKQATLLSQHYFPQVQRTRQDENPNECEAHGNLVGNHLRTRPEGAEKSILGVRGPARDNQAVNTDGRHRQDIQQTGVNVRDHHPVVKRYDNPGCKCRRQ